LRKERSSSSNRGQGPAIDDQFEAGSSSHDHAGQQRRTWQQQPPQQQPAQPAAAVKLLNSRWPAAAAGKQGSSSAAAAAAEQGSWAAGQNVEVGVSRAPTSNHSGTQEAWNQLTRVAHTTKVPPVHVPFYSPPRLLKIVHEPGPCP
jgi:hypothetical protein